MIYRKSLKSQSLCFAYARNDQKNFELMAMLSILKFLLTILSILFYFIKKCTKCFLFFLPFPNSFLPFCGRVQWTQSLTTARTLFPSLLKKSLNLLTAVNRFQLIPWTPLIYSIDKQLTQTIILYYPWYEILNKINFFIIWLYTITL